jgi:hypothetical protein
MKYYIASLLAFTEVQDTTDTIPLFLTESIPAIIPADSIEQAGEQAHKYLIERWKPEEGWHKHQANIMPVSHAFYDEAFRAYDAGILDMSDEPGRTINF